MSFNRYQEEAMSFRMASANETYSLLGLAGEVGEVCSMVAKGIRDGNKVSSLELTKELGDVLWFVAAIAADAGIYLEDVAKCNITKLSDRKARNVITGSGDDR